MAIVEIIRFTLQVATEEVKMAIDNQIYTTGSDRGSEDGYR